MFVIVSLNASMRLFIIIFEWLLESSYSVNNCNLDMKIQNAVTPSEEVFSILSRKSTDIYVFRESTGQYLFIPQCHDLKSKERLCAALRTYCNRHPKMEEGEGVASNGSGSRPSRRVGCCSRCCTCYGCRLSSRRVNIVTSTSKSTMVQVIKF